MPDNLKNLSDNIDAIITSANGVGSITAAQHNALMKEMLNKAGKYVGLPFTSKRSDSAGVVSSGSLIWNANAMNQTSDFVLTLHNQTLDVNNVERVLQNVPVNSLIHFKDYVGRSVYLTYKGYTKTQDANSADILNLSVSGFADNTNHTYQASEEYVCFLEFILKVKTSVFLINGNEYRLIKAPGNTNENTLEVNDFVSAGFMSSTIFVNMARYTNAQANGDITDFGLLANDFADGNYDLVDYLELT